MSDIFTLGEHASEIWLAAQSVIFQEARQKMARLEMQMMYHILRTSDVVSPTMIVADAT